MLWSLPRIWVYYGTYIFPYWSSFLLPMVQISIMSSIYCTIVMSWERYVRICLGLCIWRSDIVKKIVTTVYVVASRSTSRLVTPHVTNWINSISNMGGQKIKVVRMSWKKSYLTNTSYVCQVTIFRIFLSSQIKTFYS